MLIEYCWIFPVFLAMLSCDCLIPNAVKSPEIIVENVEDKSGKGILNDEPNYTHKQV